MGKLVNLLDKRLKCEVFPCKQPAEFSIGREGHKQLNFNVCRKCGIQIMEDLIEIFAESDGIKLVSVEEAEASRFMEITPEEREIIKEEYPAETLEPDTTPTTDEDITGEEIFDKTENNAPQNSDEPITNKEEVKAVETKVNEVYHCKHCEVTFPKTPEGKIALMTHSKVCAKLAKEKA